MKKIPLRTCIITKEKLPKKELIRVVRTPEGKVEIDPTGRANGRGAYLKREVEVVKKSAKALVHYLETDLDTATALIDALVQVIEEI